MTRAPARGGGDTNSRETADAPLSVDGSRPV